MLQKKKITKVLSTITLSSALLLSATVVAGNEQANVVEASTRSVRLTHNAYVYNYKGKRIKGARTLKKGRSVKAFHTKKIHGRKYLYIGNHRYIKLANVQNTKSNYLFTAKITENGLGEIYKAPNQSPTGEYIGIGQSVKVYAKENVNGKAWYKVGKNKWLPATDTDKYGVKTNNVETKNADTAENSSVTSTNNSNQKQDTQKNSSNVPAKEDNTQSSSSLSNVVTPQFAQEVSTQFIKQLNELRTSKGLQPLQTNSELQSYADTRGQEILQKFSHERPNGETTMHIEELAMAMANSSSTPQSVAKDLLDTFIYHDASANWAHRDSLLNPRRTAIGTKAVWETKPGLSWYNYNYSGYQGIRFVVETRN